MSHLLKDEGWTRTYQKRPNGPKDDEDALSRNTKTLKTDEEKEK